MRKIFVGKPLQRALLSCLFALAAIAAPCVNAQGVAAVAKLEKKSLTGSWYEIARLPNRREKHCAADAIELVALGDKPTQLQLVDACTDIKGYKDDWSFTTTNKDGSGALKVRTVWPLSRKYWVVAVGPVVPVAALAPPLKSDTAAMAADADKPVVADAASSSTTSVQPSAAATAMPAATSATGASMPHVAPPPPPPPTGYEWTLIGSPNHKQLWIYARDSTLPASDLEQIKSKAAALGFDPAKLVMTPQTQK